MPLTSTLSYGGVKLSPIQDPESAKTMAGRFAASVTIAKGTVLGRVKTAVTAVQTLTIADTPTSGGLILSYGGFSTSSIPFATYTHATPATANAAILAALEALTSIGVGNIASVTRSGTTPDFVYVITFGGTMAGVPVALITADYSAFDAGTAVVTGTTTGIAAGALKTSDKDNTDGSEVPVGIAVYDVVTDAEGVVTLGDVSPAEYGTKQYDAPFYYQGCFLKSDLVMLDITVPSGWRWIKGDGTGADDFLLLS